MKKIEAGLLLFIFLCIGFALYLAVDIFIDTDAEIFGNALSVEDLSVCDSIKDSSLKTSCVTTIAINQAIKSDDVGVCRISSNVVGCEYAFYTNKAKTLNDVGYCSFTDSRCQDEYYLNKAVVSKDKFVCNMIVDANKRRVCEAI